MPTPLLISDYLSNLFLEASLRNSAYSQPAAVYAALLKAVPIRQTATPASEVSGGSYARQAMTFGAAANGRSLLSAAITFPTPTADWATASAPVVAVAIMDATSSGNWMYAAVVCPKVILSGDPAPKLLIGGFKVFFLGD